jgi:hypothetical protein
MKRVTNDEKLPNILRSSLSELEIVDSMGNLVGLFKPRFSVKDLESTENWPSDEQIEKELNSGKPTFSSSQVIAHLRTLG